MIRTEQTDSFNLIEMLNWTPQKRTKERRPFYEYSTFIHNIRDNYPFHKIRTDELVRIFVLISL